MKFVRLLLLVCLSWSMEAQSAAKPAVAEAEQFITQAETRLNELTVRAARAQWVQENFITDDTEAISADANEQITAAVTELVEQAKRFDGLTLPPVLARKFLLLKLGLTAPAPKDPKAAAGND
jgi:peptidyl-dipeptidase A